MSDTKFRKIVNLFLQNIKPLVFTKVFSLFYVKYNINIRHKSNIQNCSIKKINVPLFIFNISNIIALTKFQIIDSTFYKSSIMKYFFRFSLLQGISTHINHNFQFKTSHSNASVFPSITEKICCRIIFFLQKSKSSSVFKELCLIYH